MNECICILMEQVVNICLKRFLIRCFHIVHRRCCQASGCYGMFGLWHSQLTTQHREREYSFLVVCATVTHTHTNE